MKETRIPFSPEMVRAILTGNKTMTRRIISMVLKHGHITEFGRSEIPDHGFDWHYYSNKDNCWYDARHEAFLGQCPYGISGDRLLVTEAFRYVASGQVKDGEGEVRYGIAYKDGAVRWNDHTTIIHDLNEKPVDTGPLQFQPEKWRHALYMPKSASRITLDITEVKVERVQDISEADAIEEGLRIGMGAAPYFSCRDAFCALWNSIHKAKPEHQWTANPWVWAIRFKRIN